MKNVSNYIKKYRNKTFIEKDVTEVDALILSLIPYVPLNKIMKDGETVFLKEISNRLAENFSKKEIKKFGLEIWKTIYFINNISKTKRFKDIKIFNHQYKSGLDYQFGAVTILLPNNTLFISFEGTDDLVSGWKEDFIMSYKYPVYSQELAIQYVNRAIKIFSPKVIIAGHSKGGNLAIVAAMNLKRWKQRYLTKVYSFDGPGLHKKQLESKKFQSIKEKIVNIIPNASFVGILLKNKTAKVIKSKGLGIYQHDAFTWEVKNDRFVVTKQSKTSKKLEKNVDIWLSKYSDEEKKVIVNTIFNIFEKANINNLIEIKERKIKNFHKMLQASKTIDQDSKKLVMDSIKLLFIENIDTNKDS